MTIASAALLLFLILDPLGNIPVFLGLLRTLPPQRQRVVLAREMLIALVVLMLFLWGGRYALELMHLRQESVSIAGGIVLFLIGLRMIFPPPEGLMGELPEGEPFIVPMAIPLVAGPSGMAAVMLMGSQEPDRMGAWSLALMIAWVATAAILFSSTYLYKWLGSRVLTAIERLMGMVIVAISVQMLLDGLITYMRLAPAALIAWQGGESRGDPMDEVVVSDAAVSGASANKLPTVDASIYPRGGLDVLSRDEVMRLRDASAGGMHELLRRCALAVLTTGSTDDDPRAARELYPDFDIQVLQQDRGAAPRTASTRPAMAFVDGRIIRGVAELLFAVVRDLVYTAVELEPDYASELGTSEGITDAVFRLLRNARVLHPSSPTWWCAGAGIRSVATNTTYTKQVGYELGLRGLDICTGCGPGAMKGPMKGATIAPRQTAPVAARATSASPSPGSSPPNRRTRSSTTW